MASTNIDDALMMHNFKEGSSACKSDVEIFPNFKVVLRCGYLNWTPGVLPGFDHKSNGSQLQARVAMVGLKQTKTQQ